MLEIPKATRGPVLTQERPQPIIFDYCDRQINSTLDTNGLLEQMVFLLSSIFQHRSRSKGSSFCSACPLRYFVENVNNYHKWKINFQEISKDLLWSHFVIVIRAREIECRHSYCSGVCQLYFYPKIN